MKQSAAYAAIRRIATLGYPRSLTLPTLLTALRDVVGFDSVNFMWLDEGYNVVDMTDPDVVPQNIMSCYLEQFANRRENEDIASNRQLVTSLAADSSALRPKFTRSILFNELMRPAGYRYFLRLGVRNGKQPVGVLNLLRTPGAKEFSREDERRLADVRPWLTHALVASAKPAVGEAMAEDGSGLVVTDARGKLQFCSRGAKVLLHCAAGVPVDRLAVDGCHDRVHGLLDKLVHALAVGGRKGGAGVPALTIASAAGYFVLRAYWIDSATPDGDSNIAIQIQRQVPLSLRLLQSPKLRGLPPREQEACLLLSRGLSSAEIAKCMGISRNGAIYHIRSFYNRFGISRQEELVSAILRPEGATAPDPLSYHAG